MSHDPALAELAEWRPTSPGGTRRAVGIDPRRLLRLRLRLMVTIGLATALPAALVVYFLVPMEYRAIVQLEYSTELPRVIGDPGRPIIDPTYDNFVNTQIRLISSQTILGRVLENPSVSHLPAMQGEKALKNLRAKLYIAPLPNTELVEINYSNVDRDTAVLVLNAVVTEYMAFRKESEASSGGQRRDLLGKMSKEYEAHEQELQDKILAKRKQLGTPVSTTQTPNGIQTISAEANEADSYRLSLVAAESEVVTAETNAENKKKDIERVAALIARNAEAPGESIYELGVEDIVNKDPAVVALTTQLTAVEQQLSVYQDRYIVNAPQLQAKRSEREGLELRLSQEKARARKAALGSVAAQADYDAKIAHANIQGAIDRRDKFKSLIAESRQRNLGQAADLAEVVELEHQREFNRKRLDEVNSQLSSAEIESKAPARVRPISAASAPSSPSPSRPMKALFAAWALCGALALAAGIMQEIRDQNIRSAEDIAFVTDIPVIANIPHLTEDRIPKDTRAERITANYPSSMTADEFRRTVARVLYAPRGGRAIRSCLIVSAARGDGKTTLACNVATILAQAERRVLLVDVDSRNPGIERSFGLKPGPGLAEMLRGEPMQHDPDRVTQFETLHVLGPGLRSQDLVELLASKEMADFLNGAEDLFDHIIIDTPASLLMAEARLLAPQVDGMIVVVGSDVSTFGMLRRCLDTMSEIGGSVLGIVMNGLRQTPGGYLRRNLDLFYREGPLPGPPAATEPSIVLVRKPQDSTRV